VHDGSRHQNLLHLAPGDIGDDDEDRGHDTEREELSHFMRHHRSNW
jgi:hypothetical protein